MTEKSKLLVLIHDLLSQVNPQLRPPQSDYEYPFKHQPFQAEPDGPLRTYYVTDSFPINLDTHQTKADFLFASEIINNAIARISKGAAGITNLVCHYEMGMAFFQVRLGTPEDPGPSGDLRIPLNEINRQCTIIIDELCKNWGKKNNSAYLFRHSEPYHYPYSADIGRKLSELAGDSKHIEDSEDSYIIRLIVASALEANMHSEFPPHPALPKFDTYEDLQNSLDRFVQRTSEPLNRGLITVNLHPDAISAVEEYLGPLSYTEINLEALERGASLIAEKFPSSREKFRGALERLKAGVDITLERYRPINAKFALPHDDDFYEVLSELQSTLSISIQSDSLHFVRSYLRNSLPPIVDKTEQWIRNVIDKDFSYDFAIKVRISLGHIIEYADDVFVELSKGGLAV